MMSCLGGGVGGGVGVGGAVGMAPSHQQPPSIPHTLHPHTLTPSSLTVVVVVVVAMAMAVAVAMAMAVAVATVQQNSLPRTAALYPTMIISSSKVMSFVTCICYARGRMVITVERVYVAVGGSIRTKYFIAPLRKMRMNPSRGVSSVPAMMHEGKEREGKGREGTRERIENY